MTKSRQRTRSLKILVVIAVAYSALQYATTGSVSWPGELLSSVREQVTGYAERPEAGWRQATNKVEELGAAREGQVTKSFDITGKVVRVADGDTVSVLDDQQKQHKIRLFGIDTPERDQPHGQTAKRALEKLVDGQRVGVVIIETDNYGRTVGTLYKDSNNINAAMVGAGHAWWYRYHAPHERLLESNEAQARKQELGLWSKPDPIPPWDWRRGRR